MRSLKLTLSYAIIISIVVLLFGKFNDGGWYTLAALSIKSGYQPFIDFHYPHTPHYAYLISQVLHLCPESIHPVLFLRIFHSLIWLIAVLMTVSLVRKENISLLAILILCQPYQIYFLCLIKSYGLIQLLLLFVLLLQKTNWKQFTGLILGLIITIRVSTPVTLLLMPAVNKPWNWSLLILALASLIPAINAGLLDHWFLPIQHLGLEMNAFNKFYLENFREPLEFRLSRKIGYLIKSLIMWSPFLLIAYQTKNVKVLILLGLNIFIHIFLARPLDEYSCFFLLPCAVMLCSQKISIPKFFYIISVIVFLIQLERFSNRLVLPQSQILQLQQLKLEGTVFGLDAHLQSNYFNSYDKRQTLGHFSVFPTWSDEFSTNKNVFNNNTLKNHIANHKFDWLLVTNSQIKSIGLKPLLNNYELFRKVPNMLEENEDLLIYKNLSLRSN